MNNVKLELEKIIEYFEEEIKEAELRNGVGVKLWYLKIGRQEAYKDAKEKCEGLLETIVGNYPEEEV